MKLQFPRYLIRISLLVSPLLVVQVPANSPAIPGLLKLSLVLLVILFLWELVLFCVAEFINRGQTRLSLFLTSTCLILSSGAFLVLVAFFRTTSEPGVFFPALAALGFRGMEASLRRAGRRMSALAASCLFLVCLVIAVFQLYIPAFRWPLVVFAVAMALQAFSVEVAEQLESEVRHREALLAGYGPCLFSLVLATGILSLLGRIPGSYLLIYMLLPLGARVLTQVGGVVHGSVANGSVANGAASIRIWRETCAMYWVTFLVLAAIALGSAAWY